MGKGAVGVMSLLPVPTINKLPTGGKLSEREQERIKTARKPQIIAIPVQNLAFIVVDFSRPILDPSPPWEQLRFSTGFPAEKPRGLPFWKNRNFSQVSAALGIKSRTYIPLVCVK
jgi:hypothetical protein